MKKIETAIDSIEIYISQRSHVIAVAYGLLFRKKIFDVLVSVARVHIGVQNAPADRGPLCQKLRRSVEMVGISPASGASGMHGAILGAS